MRGPGYASRLPPRSCLHVWPFHGELLRLLYILADSKTKLRFEALDEAIDVDSEAYCWRRSGFFWRMRASLGLACAQLPRALKFSAKPALRHEPGAHVLEQHYPTPDFGLSLHRVELSILCCISSFFLLVRAALKLRSLLFSPLRLCRIAVFSFPGGVGFFK